MERAPSVLELVVTQAQTKEKETNAEKKKKKTKVAGWFTQNAGGSREQT